MSRSRFALDIDESRAKYWKINAIRSLTRFLKRSSRDKNIWVFGCGEGKRYDDNSRYLFEHVLKSEPKILAYWFTKDPEIKRNLNLQNKPCLLIDSKEGEEILRKAGVAFFTNGIDDFGDICYLFGAKLIDLTHAPLGLKDVIHYTYKDDKGIIRVLKKLKRKIYNSYNADYTIVTSENSKSYYMRAYDDLNDERYVMLGPPRGDIIVDENYRITYPDFLDDSYQYILYMPTFRKYENDAVENFVNEVVESTSFNDILTKTRYKIIIKPHFADTNSKKIKRLNSNIVFLDKNRDCYTQELLKSSSVLITDYSSCCIDYSISSRPVILYVPDLQQYISFNGISKECEKLYRSENLTSSASGLIDILERIIQGKEAYLSITNQLLNEYIIPPINDQSYSQEVTDFVKSKIGL